MSAAKPAGDLASPETRAALTGLEFLEALKDGRLPGAPISNLLNYTLEKTEPGCTVFKGTPTADHRNPLGGVHGGWYGTLLDSCMSCAIMTMVPKGFTYTTLEYKINLTRAIPPGTQILATGWVDHAGRSTGVAHGEIRGAQDGRLYATGSTTCLIMAIKL